jgi:tRNA threonylcarbamoyladenosine biosynthesis protein TsaE
MKSSFELSDRERTLISGSEEETRKIAGDLAKKLESGDVITLRGDLGSGKTHFVKGIAETFGIDPDTVQSPTFTIIHEYRSGDALPVFHFDCYRLKHPEELLDIGIEHYLDEPGICCIEWPELAEPYLPDTVIAVQMEHQKDGKRKILIKKT